MLKEKEVGTWRAPKSVNMEQNMQWRRQGVNRESATVITLTYKLCDVSQLKTIWGGLLPWFQVQQRSTWLLPSRRGGTHYHPWRRCVNLDLSHDWSFHLTDELRLQSVQVWETFPKEESHLVSTGFLAVQEESQRAVLVHRLANIKLLDLSDAVFHQGLELSHALGQDIKATNQPSEADIYVMLLFLCFLHLSEKRDTRIMRDAAMVMTAQRTDRTLTMMVQHILGAPCFEPNSLASTPPGNIPHRAVCYDWQLRMRPPRRRLRSSSRMCRSTQTWHQTKYHSTVCSFWIRGQTRE